MTVPRSELFRSARVGAPRSSLWNAVTRSLPIAVLFSVVHLATSFVVGVLAVIMGFEGTIGANVVLGLAYFLLSWPLGHVESLAWWVGVPANSLLWGVAVWIGLTVSRLKRLSITIFPVTLTLAEESERSDPNREATDTLRLLLEEQGYGNFKIAGNGNSLNAVGGIDRPQFGARLLMRMPHQPTNPRLVGGSASGGADLRAQGLA